MRLLLTCSIGLAGISLLGISTAGAQDQNVPAAPTRKVVVTATRLETPLEQVASSVTVLEGQEIEEKHLTSVAEALRSVPGVDVVRNGSLGASTSVFIRGANSEHTLVLIDGVEANNPISPTRAFNFADLDTEAIDRIEVLRGPQSTLYGSDALGGVISIFTKKGDGQPHAYASAEAGTYNTYNERAGISGASGPADYSLGFSQQNSHGISAINSSRGAIEDDGYKNTGFSGRVGVEASPLLRFNLSTRYVHADTELDTDVDDDPNRTLRNEQVFSRAEAQTKLLDGRLRQTFGIGFSNQQFHDDNDPDARHPGELTLSKYTGRMLKFDWQNSYRAADWATILAGLETEQERGSSDYYSDGPFGAFASSFEGRTARTNGYFTQLQTSVADRFFSTAGIRLDDHSQFGNRFSWRLAPSYVFRASGTKLSSTVGTGFKAPSLFQLYSSYGNRELQPERSLGIDAGIEQQIYGDTVAAGLTYFWNNFNNLISFNPNTFISENISRARTQGVEASVSARPVESVGIRVAYTLTHARDLEKDQDLVRRPKNKVSAAVSYALAKRLTAHVDVDVVGRRSDYDYSSFPSRPVKLSTYVTVSAALSYSLSEAVELSARIENLFDRDYEEVYGFGTRGATALGGLKVKL